MTVEINKATDTHLSVAQEIKLEKPLHDFYVGQILKAVVTSANAEELMLNINGQYFKTKNSAQFSTGHLLDVRVLDNHEELVLEISNQASSKAILQAALLEALPKQAPATHLFELFSQVNSLTKIPEGVYQQIKLILNSVTTLAELPTALMHAISRSGIFFEAALLEKRKMNATNLDNDFKAQCLKLLNSLSAKQINSIPTDMMSKPITQDTLPLPGAIPQPLQKELFININDLSPEDAQSLLREQVSQVLSRINVNQINHLSHENKEGYLIMLDIPIRTPQGIDVIPLMIEQRRVKSGQLSQWSISFALNLSQLGNIQGKVVMSGREVDLKFYVEQSETMQTLEEYKNQLNHALSGMGLHLKDWKLQLGLEKNHIDVENLHLLDIRI